MIYLGVVQELVDWTVISLSFMIGVLWTNVLRIEIIKLIYLRRNRKKIQDQWNYVLDVFKIGYDVARNFEKFGNRGYRRIIF